MPTFTNQAQLSYNGIITNSNVATGEIVEVLSANKTTTLSSYSNGDTVTFVVNIINSGTAAFTGLTVTDDLGGYTFGTTATLYPLTYVAGSLRYYQNGVLQAAPTVTVNNGLTITGISVPAGGTTTLVYLARANDYAPLGTGSTITNTATVTGPDITTPIIADATIPVRDEPYLTIFKSITPNQIPENGRVTYTFDIQNLGNTATTAADNVQVLDTFNPPLTDITVTYNGTVLPATSYTYNPTTGVFSTNAGVINVPAATYTQSTATGALTVVPGTATLVVSGNL